MKFEISVAKRYLGLKKAGNIISVIGIFLGVSCLIISLSVLNGFGNLVKDMFLDFDSHIRVTTNNIAGMENWKEIERKIGVIEGVAGVSPFILGKGMLTSEYGERGTFIKGIDIKKIEEVNEIRKNIVYSSEHYLEDKSKRDGALPGIILARMLADNLFLGLGDTVLVMGSRTKGGIYSMPEIMKFRVEGYFSIKLTQYDNYALISLSDAQRLFLFGENVSGLEIKSVNRNYIDRTAVNIRKSMPENFIIKTWYDLHKTLFSSMKIERLAANIVLSLIILVAAFNIISSLIMLVMEKKREIGILKSMGATSRKIMNIFVLEGGIIASIGIITGMLVGFLLCWLQVEYKYFPLPTDTYVIDYLPVDIRVMDIISVFFIAVLICFFSTLYPAWKAAQLNPVEAIRYE